VKKKFLLMSIFVICLVVIVGCTADSNDNKQPSESTSRPSISVFDSKGNNVAWIIHERFVYAANPSNYLAFIQDNQVFTKSGIFIGFYEGGYFRDKSGNAVGFIANTKDQPAPPNVTMPYVPMIPSKPSAPLRQMMHPKVSYSSSWSSKSWSDFINGN
jgi:hypothetical protein